MVRLAALLFLFFQIVEASLAQPLTSSNLPILIIKTDGSILDEPKTNGFLTVLAPSATGRAALADSASGQKLRIGIELRGSSSQGYDKKSYGFETRDAAGADLDAPILGMPAESDWILTAPNNDKTLFRDALAYHLAGQTMAWAPRTRLCELVLNGQYEGVYLLCEKIKRSPERVAVSKLKADDLDGDQLTGGYILKLDKATGASIDGWTSPWPPYPGASQREFIQYHYPEPTKIQPAQKTYIQKFIADFESVLAGPSWADSIKGYRKLIEANSWADYFLVNELTKNLDAYRLSTYFYKDRDSLDGHLRMGPVWDFNIAFGLGDYCSGESTSGWAADFNSVCPNDNWVVPFWWKKLLSDSFFKATIKKRWDSLRASIWSDAALSAKTDSLAALLNEAQGRNFQRWPHLGHYIWPNAFVGQTYASEVDYLHDWLIERAHWMDGRIHFFSPSTPQPPALVFAVPLPNPTADKIALHYSSHPSSAIQFSLFSADGRLARRWTKLPTGIDARFEASTLDLPSGLFFWRIEADGDVLSTGKIIVRH